jgi:hypothetical protein
MEAATVWKAEWPDAKAREKSRPRKRKRFLFFPTGSPTLPLRDWRGGPGLVEKLSRSWGGVHLGEGKACGVGVQRMHQ